MIVDNSNVNRSLNHRETFLLNSETVFVVTSSVRKYAVHSANSLTNFLWNQNDIAKHDSYLLICTIGYNELFVIIHTYIRSFSVVITKCTSNNATVTSIVVGSLKQCYKCVGI